MMESHKIYVPNHQPVEKDRWAFHRWGYPHFRMVYDGTSIYKWMMTGGTPNPATSFLSTVGRLQSSKSRMIILVLKNIKSHDIHDDLGISHFQKPSSTKIMTMNNQYIENDNKFK